MQSIENNLTKFVNTYNEALKAIKNQNEKFKQLLKNLFWDYLEDRNSEFVCYNQAKDNDIYKTEKFVIYYHEDKYIAIPMVYYIQHHIDSKKYGSNVYMGAFDYNFLKLTDNLYLPAFDDTYINLLIGVEVDEPVSKFIEAKEITIERYLDYQSIEDEKIAGTLHCIYFKFVLTNIHNGYETTIEICLPKIYLNQFEEEFNNLNN